MLDYQDTVMSKGRQYMVSTVQVINDKNQYGYETAVFNDEGVEILRVKYLGEDDAKKGHQRMIKFVEMSGKGVR